MQLEVSTTAGPPTYVTVRGSYAFHSLTPLVRTILGDPITLQVQTAGLSG
jgi:hypothetical protein